MAGQLDSSDSGAADNAPSVNGETPAGWRHLVNDRIMLPAFGTILVLAMFEAAPRTELLPSRSFPPVSADLQALWHQVQSGAFWSATYATLRGWAVGLGAAVLLAVPIGLGLGASEVLGRAFRGVVEFLRPIPSVALIPLAILVFGRGLELKVFLIVYAAFWPVLIQTMYGVRGVTRIAMETGKAFGLTRPELLARIVLPSSLPYLATGIRIASALALILAVTAELVVGVPGLGREIFLSQTGGNVERMYAYIVATGLLGWGLNGILLFGERRLLGWHESHRMGTA